MFTPAVRTSCWLLLSWASTAEKLHGEGPPTQHEDDFGPESKLTSLAFAVLTVLWVLSGSG